MTPVDQKTAENKEMNILEYYNSLPPCSPQKNSFVKRVQDKGLEKGIKISPAAVRYWIKGDGRPNDPLRIEALSEVSGIPVENLFKNF